MGKYITLAKRQYVWYQIESRKKAQENAWVLFMVGFGFTSDLLRNFTHRRCFESIEM